MQYGTWQTPVLGVVGRTTTFCKSVYIQCNFAFIRQQGFFPIVTSFMRIPDVWIGFFLKKKKKHMKSTLFLQWVNANTYIIFSNVLCQASNHDCIVWRFIFIIICFCISWGIPTHPRHITATSNNKCYIYKNCCALYNIPSILV